MGDTVSANLDVRLVPLPTVADGVPLSEPLPPPPPRPVVTRERLPVPVASGARPSQTPAGVWVAAGQASGPLAQGPGSAVGLPARSLAEAETAYRLDLLAAMARPNGPLAAGRLRLTLGGQGAGQGVEVLEWSPGSEDEDARARLLAGLRQAVMVAPIPPLLRGQTFALELQIE